MAVNRVPVLKRCRSLDLDPVYLGIDKKSRRTARNANKKVSEYGLQLRAKQQAKFMYGVLEKPFRNYYDKASKMKGMVGENLLTILETRLDNVLFRAAMARTRMEARQIVDHKEVLVNGKCVNIPSYRVSAGDVIELTEKAKGLQRFKDVIEVTEGRIVPAWLEVDYEAKKGTIKELPNREAIDEGAIHESLDPARHFRWICRHRCRQGQARPAGGPAGADQGAQRRGHRPGGASRSSQA